MTTNVRKSSLSKPRQRLLDLCQRIYFGSIEQLQIRHREPILDPLPHLTQTVKLAQTKRIRCEIRKHDHCVKEQPLELFRLMDQIQTGQIASIEVQNGIPYVVILHGLKEIHSVFSREGS